MSCDWKCDISVSWAAYDPTGVKGDICGATSLHCAECHGPAGCDAHVTRCLICDEAICDGCVDEHGCVVARKPPQPERASIIGDEEWQERG